MDFLFRRSAPVLGALAFSLAAIAPLAGAAQDESDAQSIATDGIGVARLSLVDGDVAVQRGDSGDALTAVPNAPLLGGDYVTTGNTSRAEIQLDGYAHVRLGHDVQLRFTHLDTNDRSLQLAAGTLELRLLDGPDRSNAIDTPSIAIKPRQGGRYRVTVTPDGQTLVTVRSGDAEIDTPQGTQDLQPGSTLVARGNADNPSVDVHPAIALDDFDGFNADRDRADAPVAAQAAYVDPAIGGTADLGAYGRWVADGTYGNVWVPAAIGPGWAPYRDGRWVWEEGYGWTWIADEPWGWAPYHYGSWYNSPRYGWCWYPPRRHVYAPWRPALVAFIGFGVGSGIALNLGNYDRIGWVPLAPFEPYHPWGGGRRRDGTTINNTTNVVNVTNVTNNITVYRNARYNNAVSSVSSRRFLEGDFSHTRAMTAPQLREARVLHGALPVVPTASNLRFARTAASPAVSVRPTFMQHSFAGHRAVVERTPFTAQRATLVTATHPGLAPSHAVPTHAGAARAGATQAGTTQATQVHPVPAGAVPNAWSRFHATSAPVYHAAPTGALNAPREPLRAASPRQVPPGVQPNVRHSAPTVTEHEPQTQTQHAPTGEVHRAAPNEHHHSVPGETRRAPSEETHHSPPHGPSFERTPGALERPVTVTKSLENNHRHSTDRASRDARF
jgi:hypothetical protein